MQRTLISNRKAFTLVEVLAAIIILTIGLLGMFQVINLAIVTNLQNDLRTQAVLIAEEKMAEEKSLAFDSMTASSEKVINVSTPIRNAVTNYTVTLRIDDVGKSKKVDVGVSWQFKQNRYEHVITSMVTMPTTTK